MARLLADENFPLPVIRELRRLRHDVVTLEELRQADRGLTDEEVLALATGQERAVLTLNRRDFVRLHGERPDHAGIVVCTLDIDFVGQARRIDAVLRASTALQLLRINRPG